MDSHDKVRFMSYADGDVSLNEPDAAKIGWENPPRVDHKSSYDKLKLYLSYLLTIPGIPIIDYGDEFGMTGAADPDNRRMMRFGNQLSDWEKETLKDVQQLIKIRKENSALRYGDFYTLYVDDNTYAFIRSDLNERILVVFNKSNYAKNVELEIPGAYRDNYAGNILNGKQLLIENHKVTVPVESMSYSIYILKDNSNKEK